MTRMATVWGYSTSALCEGARYVHITILVFPRAVRRRTRRVIPAGRASLLATGIPRRGGICLILSRSPRQGAAKSETNSSGSR
jgi:hypothetical protein